MGLQCDHDWRLECCALHRKADASCITGEVCEGRDGHRRGIGFLFRIAKRDRLFREAEEVGERLTQLVLSFVKHALTYRYRDGIGLWRCNNCLREVPCGCVDEAQRDEQPKSQRRTHG